MPNERTDDELKHARAVREVVDRILEFQNKMGEKYGVMPDSTELLREDRKR